jgi:hypothetical protein
MTLHSPPVYHAQGRHAWRRRARFPLRSISYSSAQPAFNGRISNPNIPTVPLRGWPTAAVM